MEWPFICPKWQNLTCMSSIYGRDILDHPQTSKQGQSPVSFLAPCRTPYPGAPESDETDRHTVFYWKISAYAYFPKGVRHRRLFFNGCLFLNSQPLKRHISGSIGPTKWFTYQNLQHFARDLNRHLYSMSK